MNKEQWQELYDDLYSYNHHFKRLKNDLLYNVDLSKKRNREIEQEIEVIMSKTYNRVTNNDIVLELYEYGKNKSEEKSNKYDLKSINQYDYVLDIFLYTLSHHIKTLE